MTGQASLFGDPPTPERGCPVDGCERGALHVGSCGPAVELEQVPVPLPSEARARRADPETSHAAAVSVGQLRPLQAAVLDVLVAGGPMTDEQLQQTYSEQRGLPAQSPSGLRTRRAELVDAGLVEPTGDKRPMTTGRLARVWRATTTEGLHR